MKRSFFNSFVHLSVLLLTFSGTAMAQSITGKWIAKAGSNTVELIFNADGTGTFFGQPFNYIAANGQLEINDGQETTYYNYKADAAQLTLSADGMEEPMVFQRAAATGNTTKGQGMSGPPAVPAQSSATNKALLGKWTNASGSMEFFADGTLMSNGQKYSYSTTATKLTIVATDGQVQVDYTVTATTFTTTYNGVHTVYTKAGAGTPASNPAPGNTELTGKWCYLSATTAYSGGGSLSDECVVLNANGTYEYHNAYSSSGANGSAGSETYDSGTWSVAGTNLVFTSSKGQTTQYPFQKQNHPKNNDPMLVIGGRSYVTFFQKEPWK